MWKLKWKFPAYWVSCWVQNWIVMEFCSQYFSPIENISIWENCTQNAIYSILKNNSESTTSSHFLRLLIANALKYKLIFRIESHHHHNDNNNNFHSIIAYVWELKRKKRKSGKMKRKQMKNIFSLLFFRPPRLPLFPLSILCLLTFISFDDDDDDDREMTTTKSDNREWSRETWTWRREERETTRRCGAIKNQFRNQIHIFSTSS